MIESANAASAPLSGLDLAKRVGEDVVKPGELNADADGQLGEEEQQDDQVEVEADREEDLSGLEVARAACSTTHPVDHTGARHSSFTEAASLKAHPSRSSSR